MSATATNTAAVVMTISKLARKLQMERPGLLYEEAFTRVCESRPDLYTVYSALRNRGIPGGFPVRKFM